MLLFLILLKGIRKREKKELIKTKTVLIKLYLLSLIPELKLLIILLITLAIKKDICLRIKGALNMRIKPRITPKRLKLKTLLLQIAI